MSAVGPELIAELVDRYGRALVLYARQFCDEAEDVVQEALVKLARQTAVPDQPAAWLFRVVRRTAISASRSAARRRRREERAMEQGELWFEPTDDVRLDAQTATEAMKTLPQHLREVLVARLWGELPFDQIARLTGASTSTVHRRYREALETLRERLDVPCLEKKTINRENTL